MRKRISVICMAAGALLIAAAMLLAGYNIYDDDRAGAAAADILPKLTEMAGDGSVSDTQGSDEMTVVEIDGYGYIGYLSIPSLGLELPVMSEWDYPRLKTAPCLYYGSAKTDNMVVAAHNYTRHFGRLRELEIGADVRFTDMDGAVYNYRVGDIETLPPTATEEMIVSDWDLTLYTCTYGGKSRVTVRCARV